MKEQNGNPDFQQAEQFLQTAQNEFSRPEEDVVPYMVCKSACDSVKYYLTGFLQENGKQVTGSEPLEVVFGHCAAIDSRFLDLDLRFLFQETTNKNVWTDMDTVNKYMDIAGKVRQIVLK